MKIIRELQINAKFGDLVVLRLTESPGRVVDTRKYVKENQCSL